MYIYRERKRIVMNRNEIFELIKILATSSKYDNNKRYLNIKNNDKEYKLWNTHYLLGQVLRQYDVPKERDFIINKEIVIEIII